MELYQKLCARVNSRFAIWGFKKLELKISLYDDRLYEKTKKAVKFFVELHSFFLYNIYVNKEIISKKGIDFMPNILPVSDFRNYNEVLKNCQVGEPVFLTKNGRGKFVVMDMEDYEREKAEKKLLMKLQEAEEAVKDESAWMSLDELKKSVGV